MAFPSDKKKPMLYSDLFKPLHKNSMVNLETQHHNNPMRMMSQYEFKSSTSSDSLSSGLSSPFGSELGSSGSEDGDFMAELTRQMAEGMLKEEEEEEVEKCFNEVSGPFKNSTNLNSRLYATPDVGMTPQFQVYQLQNQPPVNKHVIVSGAKRVNETVSAHPHHHHYMQYRGGRDWRNGHTGSGMKAIFLGKSSNGSSGTGVFLPRIANDPTRGQKKSGCSTVLIPTRVLQTLEQHFSRISSCENPINGGSSIKISNHSDNLKGAFTQPTVDTKIDNPSAYHDEEMQLPQEWIY